MHAPLGAQRVADLAESDQGFDGVDDVGHQVVGAAGGGADGLQPRAHLAVVSPRLELGELALLAALQGG
jgi:hypothetical protein